MEPNPRTIATAYHEAGHAVLDALGRIPIHYATIIPELRETGVVLGALPPFEREDWTPADKRAVIESAALHLPAEKRLSVLKTLEVVLGQVGITSISPLAQDKLQPQQEAFIRREIAALFAGRIAERLKTGNDNADGALSDENRVAELSEQLSTDPAVRDAILQEIRLTTEALCSACWPLIATLAEQLLRLEFIIGDEVQEILRDAGLHKKSNRLKCHQIARFLPPS